MSVKQIQNYIKLIVFYDIMNLYKFLVLRYIGLQRSPIGLVI